MFLSIVTRTHNRPDMLARNMASIQAQSCWARPGHVILQILAGVDCVGKWAVCQICTGAVW